MCPCALGSQKKQVLSEDIYLLKQIRVTLDTSKISIVDARSLLNAKANQVFASPRPMSPTQ